MSSQVLQDVVDVYIVGLQSSGRLCDVYTRPAVRCTSKQQHKQLPHSPSQYTNNFSAKVMSRIRNLVCYNFRFIRNILNLIM